MLTSTQSMLNSYTTKGPFNIIISRNNPSPKCCNQKPALIRDRIPYFHIHLIHPKHILGSKVLSVIGRKLLNN